jgi:hypothetical protein
MPVGARCHCHSPHFSYACTRTKITLASKHWNRYGSWFPTPSRCGKSRFDTTATVFIAKASKKEGQRKAQCPADIKWHLYISSLHRISISLIRSWFYFFRSAERTLKFAVSFFFRKQRHNLKKETQPQKRDTTSKKKITRALHKCW